MRERIAPLDTPERRAVYIAGEFPRADAVKDLDVRYRWDLFYAVKGFEIIGAGEFTSDHIDTALRRIVPPLVAN
jgi:hypothetical protein